MIRQVFAQKVFVYVLYAKLNSPSVAKKSPGEVAKAVGLHLWFLWFA